MVLEQMVEWRIVVLAVGIVDLPAFSASSVSMRLTIRKSSTESNPQAKNNKQEHCDLDQS